MKESLMQVQLDEEEMDTLNTIINVLLYDDKHTAQLKYYNPETLKHIDSLLQTARENYYD